MPRKVRLPPKEDFRKCFGCGKENPAGLKLSFSWDGEEAEADFTPGELHQGWPGIMHGGLIGCLLDEAMAYVAYFHGFKGLTARTQVRIHAPLPIGEPLHITAKVVRLTRKLLETTALVARRDGSKGAEAQAVIFLTEKTDIEKTPAHQEPCGALIESSAPARAVLWDMDGVIVDTASYHFQSWQEAFASRGVTFTAADFQRGFGQRNDNIIRSVMGNDVSARDIQAIAELKETSFRRRIAGNMIRTFPGAVELITSLNHHGFRQAIASSAPMENIKLMMEALGLLTCFQAVVCGRDVTRGKPHPQVFLSAAHKLRVEPRNCVVIEDAVAGVQAARAAGMRSIAVTNSHPRESLAEADLVVDSLSDMDAGAIERLLEVL